MEKMDRSVYRDGMIECYISIDDATDISRANIQYRCIKNFGDGILLVIVYTWVWTALNLYENSGFNGNMDLSEFLTKVNPDTNQPTEH